MNWYKRAISEKDKDFADSKWMLVDSTWISYIAYYEPLGMFEVKLSNGQEYSFKDVPAKTFQSFMDSKSKGRFFNEVIKKKYKS